MHVTTINEKQVMNLKDSKERYMGKYGERKGRGEMM